MSVVTAISSSQLESRLTALIRAMKSARPSRELKVPSLVTVTLKWWGSPPYSNHSEIWPLPKMVLVAQLTAQGVPRWA